MSSLDTVPLHKTGSPLAVYQRIGDLTRSLHEALQELGYDKRIAASLDTLPDAKDRLSFISRVTGNAAEKVLNTVDAAQCQQEALAARAASMQHRLALDPAAATASGEFGEFVAAVRSHAELTSHQLTDIMLAQDFHDLTGQTVLKLVDIAVSLESSLVSLLTDESLQEDGDRDAHDFLDGPVANPASRSDVVANQAQVDDLLESLGF